MRVAAIDVGTNSVRLLVAEQAGTRIEVVAQDRIRTRLGSGLYEDGRITPAAAERTRQALERMTCLAAELGCDRLRAVGTSALREASNAGELLEAARQRLSLDIEVISETEEAELAFRSARHYFELGSRPVLVADIGGGSLELVHARGSEVLRVDSLPLGAVRLTETFLESDPVTEGEWRSLVDHVDALLGPAVSRPHGNSVHPALLGSGGTYSALAFMALAGSRPNSADQTGEGEADRISVLGQPLMTTWIESTANELRALSEAERRDVPGLMAERADIILAGVAVALRIAQLCGSPQTLVNDRGIRYGMALEMLEEPA
ncbi:MAG: hypothetical protein ABFS14_09730 [Gemmatimonadota bacterium]